MKRGGNPSWIAALGLAAILGSLAIVGTGTNLQATQATGVAWRQSGGAEFDTLLTAEALEADQAQVDLGSLIEGESFVVVDLLRIRNIHTAALNLSVELVAMPGFSAAVLNDQVSPGEEAILQISGAPTATGPLTGRIIVRALGGYLQLAIPVTAEVLPKPAPAEGTTEGAVEVTMPVEEAPLVPEPERGKPVGN